MPVEDESHVVAPPTTHLGFSRLQCTHTMPEIFSNVHKETPAEWRLSMLGRTLLCVECWSHSLRPRYALRRSNCCRIGCTLLAAVMREECIFHINAINI
eukprot:6206167-Amphidinium_carterae.1